MTFPLPIRSVFLATACLALTACAPEPNPTATSSSGATLVQIRSGLNCFNNQCFSYKPSNGAISVAGRRDTSPPAGVNLASGAITPAQFKATFEKGVRARTIGGNER